MCYLTIVQIKINPLPFFLLAQFYMILQFIVMNLAIPTVNF